MSGLGRDIAWSGRQLRRFLRGGISGFRIFLACLIAGVTAIAAVGSLSESLDQGPGVGLREDHRIDQETQEGREQPVNGNRP